MKGQLESSSAKAKPRRGLIRKWLLLALTLVLIWNVRGAMKYAPAAIRRWVPSFDAAPDPPPPGAIQAPAQPAAAVPDAAKPDTAATAPSTASVRAEEGRVAQPAGASGFSVQVAAFPDPEEARTLSEQLGRAGYSAYLTTATVNQVRYHRVRVGPFQTRQAAQQVAQRLETQGYQPPWITN